MSYRLASGELLLDLGARKVQVKLKRRVREFESGGHAEL